MDASLPVNRWQAPTTDLAGDAPFERFDPLEAHGRNDACELLDPRGKPAKLLGSDAIVLGVAGLDVGVLELLEHCALAPAVRRPHIGQTAVDALGLGARSEERRVGKEC